MNTRHKDSDWQLPTNPDGRLRGWQYVPIALLMDIRDELKQLNRLLHCPNFISIPKQLRAIHRKLPAPRKPRGKP